MADDDNKTTQNRADDTFADKAISGIMNTGLSLAGGTAGAVTNSDPSMKHLLEDGLIGARRAISQIRGLGFVGRFFKPAAIFTAGADLYQGYQADGMHGLAVAAKRQTGVLLGGLPGAWAGAAAGTALIPIPVVGTLVGGLAGGFIGSALGKGLVNYAINNWAPESLRNYLNTPAPAAPAPATTVAQAETSTPPLVQPAVYTRPAGTDAAANTDHASANAADTNTAPAAAAPPATTKPAPKAPAAPTTLSTTAPASTTTALSDQSAPASPEAGNTIYEPYRYMVRPVSYGGFGGPRIGGGFHFGNAIAGGGLHASVGLGGYGGGWGWGGIPGFGNLFGVPYGVYRPQAAAPALANNSNLPAKPVPCPPKQAAPEKPPEHFVSAVPIPVQKVDLPPPPMPPQPPIAVSADDLNSYVLARLKTGNQGTSSYRAQMLHSTQLATSSLGDNKQWGQEAAVHIDQQMAWTDKAAPVQVAHLPGDDKRADYSSDVPGHYKNDNYHNDNKSKSHKATKHQTAAPIHGTPT